MPNRMPRVCVVGSTNVDLTFRTPRLPRPGETLTGGAFLQGFGGKGANQAVMAARLGARVTMLSRVGNDAFGAACMENYRVECIDARHVAADPERPTGTAAILVDDGARNCIIVVPGANSGLGPQHVRAAAGAIEGADVLLGQLEVPLDTTREAFRIARAAGVRTVLNPAPAVPLPDEFLSLADVCVPNETEIEQLTGTATPTREAAEVAARELQARGPRAVIVTLGDRGALVVEAQDAEFIPAVSVDAVDPTGAGDAFIGSLAVFLAEGAALRESARRANVVAALAVTRPGAQAAFPRREEAMAFLARGYGDARGAS
jgi:ribokinase